MLKAGIIISCQPVVGSPLDTVETVVAYARAAEQAGAVAVKIEGVERVRAVKDAVRIPVIGIVKRFDEIQRRCKLTTHIPDVVALQTAKADFIATEALKVLGNFTRDGIDDLIFEADIVTTAKIAEQFGAAYIATTLCGYTELTRDRFSPDPDLDFLTLLEREVGIPLIAEGRYSQPEHIKRAIEIGAQCVCIGTAITRPEILAARFVEVFENAKALYHS